MKLKLNWELPTLEERREFVQKYMAENSSEHFTNDNLETIANYLLYGKEPDKNNTNVVDRKEIQIKPKHSSYQKAAPESLEALLESPGFNESMLQDGIKYKKVKQTIDREKDADIPGMKELWERIDELDHRIKVTEGKEEDENVKPFSTYGLYVAKHTLIEMRSNQYMLKDSFRPMMGPGNPADKLLCKPVEFEIPWDAHEDYSIAPLGLYSSCRKRFDDMLELEERDYHWNENAKYVLDFRNPEHIYHLLDVYEDFLIISESKLGSLCGDIIETLDWYITAANLGEEKKEILDLKIKKYPVLEIQQILKKKFGTNHSTNYISTIYKQKICEEIASAASLHYDSYMERENRSMWKKCNCCGEWKLLDSKNFMRKVRSSDGYNNRCKICCKEERKNRKENK